MTDKTNFAQSLMHMIKGNLGTGILAMPKTFSHCGMVNAIIGLPLLCIMATYCVHLLVRSSQHLESKMKMVNLEYAELAKGAFKAGPNWMRPWSGLMCRLVDAILIISQIGICCVYLVFIATNVEVILKTYGNHFSQTYIFAITLPFILLISFIRTLKRLSIASAFANALQVVGISIIIHYLLTHMPEQPNIVNFKPISEVALGFGSAMFAFEGISVVLPIYTRMKRSEQMGGCFGIINLSYTILLVLYFMIGLFGYLGFGADVKDSISESLPQTHWLYDCVRAIFAISIFLTYPLQFYVPNEIIWNWARSKLFITDKTPPKQHLKYEYLCRAILVLLTYFLAICIPKLNLLMDLVGSISGTALSIILPPIIHIAAFWDDTSGVSKVFMIIVDGFLILIGLFASFSGSYFSIVGIINSFGDEIA